MSRFYDATVLNKVGEGGSLGFTLGPYINTTHAKLNTLRHEYGHVLQSRLTGPAYLLYVALPSVTGCIFQDMGIHDHDHEWYETNANILSFEYLTERDPDSLAADPWDDFHFPRRYVLDWYYPISLIPGATGNLLVYLGLGYIF